MRARIIIAALTSILVVASGYHRYTTHPNEIIVIAIVCMGWICACVDVIDNAYLAIKQERRDPS